MGSPLPDASLGTLYGVLPPNIRRVCLGDQEFDTWYGNTAYFAPDQATLGFKYSNQHLTKRVSVRQKGERLGFWLDTLYLCDLCFKYSDCKADIDAHRASCPHRTQLPGSVLYRAGEYLIRRVRGAKHRLFCQNLCLFGKLFLDNKSIFFSVEAFELYVVYGEMDGARVPMGFFSKELVSWEENNLACIVVFPPFQRRQLGTLLIEFSYALSRSEGLQSGPELPLSPFGRAAYLPYWCRVLARAALEAPRRVTLRALCQETGLRCDDALLALAAMGALERHTLLLGNISHWVAQNQKAYDTRVLQDSGLVFY